MGRGVGINNFLKNFDKKGTERNSCNFLINVGGVAVIPKQEVWQRSENFE